MTAIHYASTKCQNAACERCYRPATSSNRKTVKKRVANKGFTDAQTLKVAFSRA